MKAIYIICILHYSTFAVRFLLVHFDVYNIFVHSIESSIPDFFPYFLILLPRLLFYPVSTSLLPSVHPSFSQSFFPYFIFFDEFFLPSFIHSSSPSFILSLLHSYPCLLNIFPSFHPTLLFTLPTFFPILTSSLGFFPFFLPWPPSFLDFFP